MLMNSPQLQAITILRKLQDDHPDRTRRMLERRVRHWRRYPDHPRKSASRSSTIGSHLGCALGHAPIDAGYRVLFTRTSEVAQKLHAARQSLQLPSALAKLAIILDDLSYP